MSDVTNTLQERGNRYGEFHEQSNYAQDMKAILRRSPNWATMTNDQREGLDMIANKIARILNGDPNYADSWHDIAGYAQLVEKRIEELQTPAPILIHKAHAFKKGDLVRVKNSEYSSAPRQGQLAVVSEINTNIGADELNTIVEFSNGDLRAYSTKELELA